MNQNLILLFSLNNLQNINKSLYKKKLLSINPITNFMLVTTLYDDIVFKSHFRLMRSSVKVIQSVFHMTCKIIYFHYFYF